MTQADQNSMFLAGSLSRLLPEVFFHPVWIHFVRNLANSSPTLIQNTISLIQSEQTKHDLAGNCQVMFICAFLQSRIGDHAAALTSIEQSLIMAEAHGLQPIARCAAWGACAICARQEKYQEAARWLGWLQGRLNKKDEWVLSNILDLFRETLDVKVQSSGSGGDLLDYLLRWGEWQLNATSGQKLMGEQTARSGHLPPEGILSGFAHLWRFLWSSVRRIINGEAVLQQPPLIGIQADIDEIQEENLEQKPRASRSTSLLQQQVTRSSHPSPSPPKHPDLPSLAIYCLGPFRIYQDDQLINAWPSGKGKAIFKYMVANIERPISRDVLMDVFWREADPEAARRNLHQAIYSLRKTLKQGHPNFQHIRFEKEFYSFNPDMILWLDYQEFEKHILAGQRLEASGRLAEAIVEYSVGEALYQGDFLEEDLYEDWPKSRREYFRSIYLDTLDHLVAYYLQQGEYAPVIALCHKTLAKDGYHEDAHKSLIQCYLAQGQRNLAIRQYYAYVEALRSGLDLEPTEEIKSLYVRITSAG
jgi:DNA-binding SARP family transcriptional activator